MDRRILKTRQALQTALLDLIDEKPFETIQIQEITERANTARVTFYRHYATKEELLSDTLEGIYQGLKPELEHLSVEQLLDFRHEPPCLILFNFLDQDRNLHRKLFTGSVSALIQQRLRHYIVLQITMTFNSAPHYADLPIGLIANQFASSMIGNVMWWLADDVPYSAAYMAQLTHWMALAGAMTLVGRGAELMMPPIDTWRITTHPVG